MNRTFITVVTCLSVLAFLTDSTFSIHSPGFTSFFLADLVLIMIGANWPTTRERFFTFLLFLVEYFFILLLCRPFGYNQELSLILHSFIIIQIGFFLPLRTSSWLTVLVLIFGTFFSNLVFLPESTFFNHTMPEIPEGRQVMMFVELFFVSGFACFTGFHYQSAAAHRVTDEHNSSVIRSLSKVNHEYQEYAFEIKSISTTDERNRITRELHDISGHIFTSIIAMMKMALLNEQSIGSFTKLHQDVLELAQEGLNDTRAAVRDIRSTRTAEQNLFDKTTKLVENFELITGINVRLILNNTRLKYERVIEHTIYRAIQEGLTNSLTHGQATEVEILMQEVDYNLNLYIIDNGRGEKKIQQGVGLSGITERTSKLSGKIEVSSNDFGFKIFISLPLNPGLAS
ncbi:sensor histidine kinase [Marispirochaeta sp.]|uniref:sensor histidine kinase n=1 Tax=Marispirochaeta sp. TaxID=2038653 RepID=UPI0029C7EB62|nr:sensor histidine kinase [Marispirochaeta sp.]